ncbi:hypothetical protein KAR28_04455 [Candidatus Parcubacteria bacterium]|nr:hypothetical protein [Candidatus Parcubacteria bacterium]
MKKSNLEILQEIKREYDPKTAFGNVVLIELINNFRLPNKDGKFETVATIYTRKITEIDWECVDCGHCNILNIDEDANIDVDDEIDGVCGSCRKKHRLTISD